MKKKYLSILFWLPVCIFQLYAQAPNLPVKTSLATILNGSKIFNDSMNPDVISFPLSNPNEFTLEVKAKINAAQVRGLDVEVKNSLGLGFRTSLDKTTFNNATAFPAITNLSTSVDNAQEQTYRYVVKDGIANIYQDGHYLTSKALDFVTDNSGDQQTVYGADNMLGRWVGIVGSNSGRPTDYGWSNTSTSIPWNTANSTSGVRYLDVTSGHLLESDNTAYKGRIMYIRWDSSSYSSSTYSYPIKLEKGMQYEFSWLYEYVSNAAAGAKMSVAISTAADGSGVLASKTFTTGNANRLRKGDLSFTSLSGGTYYLTVTGAYALFGIADLQLKSSNLINTWDGFVNNNSGTPEVYGWANSGIPTIFTAANSTSGARYMDVTSGHTFESDNSNYSGRLMYMRWDNATVENSAYSFPVQLEASKDYQFSWIYEYLSNLAPGAKMTVSITTLADATGIVIASKDFLTGAINKLRKGDLSFLSQNSGTYYITITGDKALFGIADLKVQRQIIPKIVIGKNYAAGAVDMVVSSVTYEDVAYAPEKIIAPSSQILETTDNLNIGALAKSKVVLKSSASLYLNNAYNPLINSTVDLNSTDARVYFENVKPSEVVSSYLNLISINGIAAANNANVFVTTYGNGAVVVPHSSDYQPLEVFSGENYGGDAKQYNIVTPYANLGAFDNNIKSFKLKKGYMATFASNSNGTGYSRVYVAETQDLMVPVLPAYLNGTISFLRTMRWNEVTKKGLAGGSQAAQDASNISWYYNWNTGGNTTPNIEYVPIRQTLYWPDFGPANTKAGYTHFLGYNEPDRPDQSNMTVDQAIGGWPGMMQSGLRLGSPVTSDPFNPWMASFMTEAEKRNYRVDYVVLHCYWYKTAAQWASDLQTIYNKYKRPIWITEWNIGANWTGNNFPDGPVMLTDANATKHKNDLIAVLNVLESADYVERYSIYNWVQDARAMYVTIDDAFKTRNPNWANYAWLQTAPVIAKSGMDNIVLTPAGEYHAKNPSKKAYNPSRDYVSVWKPKVETLSYVLSSDYKNITINWTGTNQDLINKYIVERKLEGETDFSVFYESTNFNILSVNDEVHSKAEYRIKVVGKDNVETNYSPVIIFTQAVVAEAPTNLNGEAISTTIINLNWSATDGAQAYNLWRANSIDGSYELIASYLPGTSFQDTGLIKNTTYYYAVTALNSGGESAKSTPLTLSTLDLMIPKKVSNLVLASGDAKVKLEWSNMYDAKFYIKRSNSEFGPFETIATAESENYVDLTAVNGVIYYYKVVAFNEIGDGVDSSVIISRPDLGQHAYYDFSENTGLNAHDQWGNYDGTLAEATTWAVGKAGSGVDFNGSSTSYIKLKDGVVEGLNDFTIATWVNTKSLTNNTRIFDFGYDTATWMAFIPYYGDNKIRYKISYGGNSAEVLGNYTLPQNQWVHLALVQSGDICKIYADGVEIASGTVILKPSGLGKTTANYLIKSQWPSDPFLNASMDEFKIYNRALSASEIVESSKLNQSITLSQVIQKQMGDADFSPAITSSGLTVSYTSSNTAVATIIDGKIHITGAGTTTITASQAGNETYNAAKNMTQELTVLRIDQSITFNPLTNKILGDTDFNPEATASSNLAISYRSSKTTVATIVNDQIHIIGVGTTTITASQAGNEIYNAATDVSQTLTVISTLKVKYQNGDNNNLMNNHIKPNLTIYNEGNVAVPYNELTLRYWVTAENYAGINTWIDYAQLGNNKVKMKYIALPTPRNGAYGYVEYSFEPSAGNLLNAANSGPIQSRFANSNWSNLNENDDYSYANASTFVYNEHITMYRNGKLVWGVEPAIAPAIVNLKVYTETKSIATSNTINTYLKINNEGNVPVNYSDVKVRYWFTKEGTANLNYYLDYAVLGNSNIESGFVNLNPSQNTANTYLELGVKASLGNLYPSSSTGNIQYRIAKSDWSNFNQLNDHSYNTNTTMALNDKVTVYYQGQLIYGIEPSVTTTSKIASEKEKTLTISADKPEPVLVYPNPVTNVLNVKVNELKAGSKLELYSFLGTKVRSQTFKSSLQEISFEGLPSGSYLLYIISGNETTIKNIIKK